MLVDHTPKPVKYALLFGYGANSASGEAKGAAYSHAINVHNESSQSNSAGLVERALFHALAQANVLASADTPAGR